MVRLKDFQILQVRYNGALSYSSCNFLKKLEDLEVEGKRMHFLLGLDSGFHTTISNILSMDPIPTIYRAFSFSQHIKKQ